MSLQTLAEDAEGRFRIVRCIEHHLRINRAVPMLADGPIGIEDEDNSRSVHLVVAIRDLDGRRESRSALRHRPEVQSVSVA